ncbi:MAG: nucleoside deaminase [Phycisphaerales bacterium]
MAEEADDRTRGLAWMSLALEQAEKSWNEGGIPIGAVLMNAVGEVVARGHNERAQSPPPGDPTAHAEITCLRHAGRRRDWRELILVSTLMPCSMCAGAVALFQIGRLVVGEAQTFAGSPGILAARGCAVTVLDDPRCIAWMQRLQRERPDLWAEDIGE